MDIEDVRQRARAMGLSGFEEKSKGDLIRTIQIAEGCRDCYGNLWRFDCLELDCCWREDCLTKNPG